MREPGSLEYDGNEGREEQKWKERRALQETKGTGLGVRLAMWRAKERRKK